MAQLISEYGAPINPVATTSAANTAGVRTITCPTEGRIRLRTITVYASTTTTATLTVTVGGVVVMDFGTLSLTVAATVVSPNLVGAVGQNVVITVGAAGGGNTTTTTHSAEVL